MEKDKINSLNCTYTELRQNIQELNHKDWFFISLIKNMNKDFIRQFEDRINLTAFIHRWDLDKNFLYEIVGKKDSDIIFEFIASNYNRFCTSVKQVLVQNKDCFTEEQKIQLNTLKQNFKND